MGTTILWVGPGLWDSKSEKRRELVWAAHPSSPAVCDRSWTVLSCLTSVMDWTLKPEPKTNLSSLVTHKLDIEVTAMQMSFMYSHTSKNVWVFVVIVVDDIYIYLPSVLASTIVNRIQLLEDEGWESLVIFGYGRAFCSIWTGVWGGHTTRISGVGGSN